MQGGEWDWGQPWIDLIYKKCDFFADFGVLLHVVMTQCGWKPPGSKAAPGQSFRPGCRSAGSQRKSREVGSWCQVCTGHPEAHGGKRVGKSHGQQTKPHERMKDDFECLRWTWPTRHFRIKSCLISSFTASEWYYTHHFTHWKTQAQWVAVPCLGSLSCQWQSLDLNPFLLFFLSHQSCLLTWGQVAGIQLM